jgi:hypothetical protein
VKLSLKAIQDLRIALRKSYGDLFDAEMSDEQINHIGVLALTGLIESLKIEVADITKQSSSN